MDISQKLSQKQNQILTPLVKQSLEVVRMSKMEIIETIKSELEKNPMLETTDYSWDNFKYYSNKSENTDNDFFAGDFISNEYNDLSFKEILKEQLLETNITKNENAICDYIIDLLNSKGFLLYEAFEIANDLKCDEKLIEKCIGIIKNFEPIGVCSKNINECLLLQLEKKGKKNSITEKIINECLELIADNKINKLSYILNLPKEEILKYIKLIKTLNPIPSQGYNTENDSKMIIPEAYVLITNEKIKIKFNNGYIKALKISNIPYDKKTTDKKDLEYIKSNTISARNLIDSINFREKTLEKIISVILNVQKNFFIYNAPLKSLKMQDIADKLDISLSTVSRALNEAYVVVNDRNICLKKMLSLSYKRNDNIYSADYIKKFIGEIIKNEDKCNPYSDLEIMKILSDKNLIISRRTVAKYRDILNIPNNYKRKI